MKKFEYHLETDIDLLNVSPNIPSGMRRVNELAEKGWEPFMVVRSDALGYKTALMFRRERAEAPYFAGSS